MITPGLFNIQYLYWWSIWLTIGLVSGSPGVLFWPTIPKISEVHGRLEAHGRIEFTIKAFKKN